MDTRSSEAPSRRAQSRTGRPYRPPEDRIAPDVAVVDPRLRTAWLLGTSRMLVDDGAYAQRRDFVAALNEYGINCDGTRVSRWESGALPAGTAVIEAYEEILGLPTYQLRGAVDLVRLPGVPAHGVWNGPEGATERLDELLTATLDGRATGEQWLELAQRIKVTEAVYLRASDWRALTRRLVTECCRSVFLGSMMRSNALGKFIAYPRAQRHVLRAIGEVVLDQRIALRGDPVYFLRRIPGPQTSLLALRLAESPDPVVRLAAVRTTGGMLADGTFDSDAMPTLVDLLTRQLRADPTSTELADAAARLPEAELVQVQAATGSRALQQVAATYETVAKETAVAAVRQLTAAVNAHVHSTRVESHGMLERLLRDGLFHSHFRRRVSALSVLSASQYADPIGDALVELLDHGTATVSAAALEAAPWFVRDRHAGALLGVATGARPAGHAALALRALGSLPSAPGADVLDPVAGLSAHPESEVSQAAVALLGMLGETGRSRGTDDAVVAAAHWWQHEGPRLTR